MLLCRPLDWARGRAQGSGVTGTMRNEVGSWHCRPGQDACAPPAPKLGALGLMAGEAAVLPVLTGQKARALQTLPEATVPQPQPRAHNPEALRTGGGARWGLEAEGQPPGRCNSGDARLALFPFCDTAAPATPATLGPACLALQNMPSSCQPAAWPLPTPTPQAPELAAICNKDSHWRLLLPVHVLDQLPVQ